MGRNITPSTCVVARRRGNWTFIPILGLGAYILIKYGVVVAENLIRAG